MNSKTACANSDMREFLTRVEIDRRFPDEWVLLDNPKTDKHLHVRGGRVLFHSKNRDEVHRKAVELQPKRFSVVYTGKIPKGSAVIL